MQLLIATSNLHKILEFKAILKHVLPSIDLLSLKDFSNYTLPEETGTTFEANAILKAEHAAKTLGLFAIADDSGLVVPALSGEPGIFSARYAGEGATDADNRTKLIGKLKGLPVEERSGYFAAAISFASPTQVIKTTQGFCEGRLLIEPKGRSGFGYDSLFIKYDYSKTMAELDEDTKNRISHRRKAMDKLLLTLESHLLLASSESN